MPNLNRVRLDDINMFEDAIVSKHGEAYYSKLLQEIQLLESDSQMLNDLIEMLLDERYGSWFGVCHDDKPKPYTTVGDEYGHIKVHASTTREAIAAAIKEWKEKE
jgi:hypothetical protein